MLKYLNLLKEEFVVNMKIAYHYRFSFITDIIIFTSLILFFILSNSGYKFTIYYSDKFDSKNLILCGYIMWMLSLSSINTMCGEIRLETLQSIIEYKCMSIFPMQLLLFLKVLSSLIIQIIELIIILLFFKFFFNLTINFNYKIILIMIVTFLGMYGLSLTIGSFILLKKKIGQLTMIIQLSLLFISNVFTIYSINIFVKLIPLGIGNHLIRLIYVNKNIDTQDIILFIISNIIWIIIGVSIFNLSLNKVKEFGSLNLY